MVSYWWRRNFNGSKTFLFQSNQTRIFQNYSIQEIKVVNYPHVDSIKIKLNTGDDFIIKELKVHSFTNIIISSYNKFGKLFIEVWNNFNEIYVFVMFLLFKHWLKANCKERIYKSGKYPIHYNCDFFQMPDTVFDVGGKYNRIGVIFLINLWINIICKMT